MEKRETYYPKVDNLGENCEFWDNQHGCWYPKAEMMGRMSCDGIIDPVCIYLKDGIKVEGFDLTEEQITELKTKAPEIRPRNYSIPAGRPLKLE